MTATNMDQDRLSDARHVGRAVTAMVRLWERAPLPFPFRLPDSASWRGRASSAMEPDFIDEDPDQPVSPPMANNAVAALRANQGALDDAGADRQKVGEEWSVGRLRATCTILVHGDPRLHALVHIALTGTTQKDSRND